MWARINISLITFSIICLIAGCRQTEKLKSLQTAYIPKAISYAYIGMPIKDLKEIRGAENLSVTKKNGFTILKEEFSKDSINLVQYHFDHRDKLVKIIIDYSDDYKAYDIFKESLGEPNSNKAWSISLDNKHKLLIWFQQTSLCIADNKQFKN